MDSTKQSTSTLSPALGHGSQMMQDIFSSEYERWKKNPQEQKEYQQWLRKEHRQRKQQSKPLESLESNFNLIFGESK